ncbi:hypothetical protein [Arthrobacter sp. ISL-95]|uniref:hypothetical protein n=1 Tax=Arthrobacter sp. ISL-95 TaxID=2819116 RepID=UPI001BEB7A93|nr:hypothetical protein [Arthrobacter sp. ISL-95]MBT2587907.1 hypothetical protein [Arthrobacter sp. ISL-95]
MSAQLDAALFTVESIHHIHGQQCLCGFASSVSRDRTKHIMGVTLAAAASTLRGWYEERMDAEHATDVVLSDYEAGREVGATEGILAAALKLEAS